MLVCQPESFFSKLPVGIVDSVNLLYCTQIGHPLGRFVGAAALLFLEEVL